ncbi:alpha/beta fold hydrolase [Natrinema caseinilyticum]|uniref:alpha/beta fold hydrolase n=1 Tax=Natrinema caseinilyticum TaxID=2961570 RepID=UPI0020C5948A|nr:hypothetical protein [Natrinema caseinilyticum]
MNRHELVDSATVTVSALVLRGHTFFSRSLASPHIGDALSDTSLTLDAGASSGTRDVVAETPAGRFRSAYRAWQWHGDDAPTLIYHHGSGEDPFDFGRFGSNSFERLFATDAWDVPANVIAVRAPFHDRSSLDYARSMGDLANFVGMCVTSTALVDALTGRLHDRGHPAVVVSGLSLGGWITNLHRAFFGTADGYAPLFAGASLGEMFVSSVYRKMTGSRARDNPDRLREVLDFDRAFLENTAADCTPLLARYDRIVEFETQRHCYDELSLATLEKGHVTGSLATDRLREHVRGAIDGATPSRT